VIGDPQSGKTSIIRSICNNNDNDDSSTPYNNNNNSVFTLHTNDHDYTVQFIEDEVVTEKHLLTTDLILLVIEYDLDESLDQFQNTWLPLIQHSRKPFFLVQTKIDLNENCQLLDFSGVNELFVGGAVFSTLMAESDDLRDALVFKLFEFLFFSPTSTLYYDEDKKQLKQVVKSALKRAFWLMDKDGDSILNTKEYLKFAKLANVKYTLNECLDIVASSVKQGGGGGGSSSGLNLEQFLSLYDYLVDNDSNVQAVWRVLRAFDVNTGLAVEDRAIIEQTMPRTNPSQDQIVLSDAAYKELTRFFKLFDRDRDGLLSVAEIDEAFSIAFDVENPFVSFDSDYINLTSSQDGKLTIQGWLSLWSIVTLHNPYSIIRCLIRWGIKTNLKQYLSVNKMRKYREKPSDSSKVVNAYIFGSSRCGKTSIMQNLIDWEVSDDTYTRTTRQQTVVNIAEDDKGDSFYLAITEFEDNAVLDVLESTQTMDLCDIAIMVFDGADPYSFSYLAKLQQKLDPTIPCIYVLSKDDLEVEEQIHDVPPQEFCEELGLLWPPFYHCATQYDPERHKTFEEVLYFAQNPKDACPMWDAAESSDSEDEGPEQHEIQPKSSLLSRTIKLVSVVSVIAIGSALLWKFAAKSKKEEDNRLSEISKKTRK